MSFTLNRNIGHRGELRLSRRLSLPTPRTCPQCLAQVATPTLLRGPPQLAASFISNRCWWLGQIFGTGLFCSPVPGGVLLSSHLIGASQNDEIIEPIVHRLLSYFMLICEILSWSASALNGLLMKQITPAYLASIIRVALPTQ